MRSLKTMSSSRCKVRCFVNVIVGVQRAVITSAVRMYIEFKQVGSPYDRSVELLT